MARVRSPDLTPALASMVFVARPPQSTPTGRYLGCVHLQRLLREPPFELVAGAIDSELARLSPDAGLPEVTRFFATYNLVCAPVVDDEDHLLGAVTVDDVLDHLLPGQLAASPDWPTWPRAPGRPLGAAMAECARRRLDQPKAGRRFAARHRPGGIRPVLRTPGPVPGHRHVPVLADPPGDPLDHAEPVAVSLRWDPYPFILLNLAFSTQAAYAAPLILLAQNRQDDRDRISLEEDRARAAQTKADTEFLARELAALRVAIGEVATRDYLRGELDRLRVDLEELTADRDGDQPAPTPARRERRTRPPDAIRRATDRRSHVHDE